MLVNPAKSTLLPDDVVDHLFQHAINIYDCLVLGNTAEMSDAVNALAATIEQLKPIQTQWDKTNDFVEPSNPLDGPANFDRPLSTAARCLQFTLSLLADAMHESAELADCHDFLADVIAVGLRPEREFNNSDNLYEELRDRLTTLTPVFDAFCRISEIVIDAKVNNVKEDRLIDSFDGFLSH